MRSPHPKGNVGFFLWDYGSIFDRSRIKSISQTKSGRDQKFGIEKGSPLSEASGETSI